MHLKAPFCECAFSVQIRNATFSKKLRFISNQTGFLYFFSSKWAFGVEKAETNRHLVTYLILITQLIAKAVDLTH